MFRHLGIRQRLIGGYLVLLIAVAAVLAPLMLHRLAETIHAAERRELEAHYQALQASIAQRGWAGAAMAELVAAIPEVRQAFAERDRERLESLLLPSFAALRDKVDQFQFHLPDSRSFLRLHMPERWGDDLSAFRHTVNTANRDGAAVIGLEKGVAGFGIRAVVPVAGTAGHVGTVEFGMDVADDFVARFQARFGTDLALVFGTGGDAMLAAGTAPVLGTRDEWARAVDEASTVRRAMRDGTPVALMVAPLHDFSGRVVGVAELSTDASHYVAQLRAATHTAIGIGAGIVVVGAGLAWLIGESINRPLMRATRALDQISRGELDRPVPGSDRQDGLGGLARSIETFRQRSLESRRLRAVEKQMAAIVAGSNDAIIGKRLDGIVTSWNRGAQRMFGYSAAEMIGQSIIRLAPPGAERHFAEMLERVGQGESVEHVECRRRHKDGRLVDVLLTLSPIRAPDGRLTGVASIAHDISERKRDERALQKLNRALRTLSAGNQALLHAEDEQWLIARMCRIITRSGYRLAWVGMAPAPGLAPQTVAFDGDGHRLEEAMPPWILGPDGPVAAALHADGGVVVHDDPTAGGAAGTCGCRSAAALPLRIGGDAATGVLTILSEEPDAFDADELRLLEEMAADLSFGIRTLRMRADSRADRERLDRAMDQTVGALAAALEMRDPYTAGHQRRVAEMAVAIGRRLGLDEKRLRGLLLAGMVHDIGKISVPADILSKPGQLTEIELAIVRGHCATGRDILAGIDFPWPVAEIAGQHHERLDGSGYPLGLAGDDILLESRILAVADVVEAMSSHRPYRPAMGIAAAREEIRARRGQLYDPAAVDACLAALDAGALAAPGA